MSANSVHKRHAGTVVGEVRHKAMRHDDLMRGVYHDLTIIALHLSRVGRMRLSGSVKWRCARSGGLPSSPRNGRPRACPTRHPARSCPPDRVGQPPPLTMRPWRQGRRYDIFLVPPPRLIRLTPVIFLSYRHPDSAREKSARLHNLNIDFGLS